MTRIEQVADEALFQSRAVGGQRRWVLDPVQSAEQLHRVPQPGGEIRPRSRFPAFDLVLGQRVEHAAVGALDRVLFQGEHPGVGGDRPFAVFHAVDVKGEERRAGGIAHLVHQLVADAEDVAGVHPGAGQGADFAVLHQEHRVLGGPENLHRPPLGVAVIVNRRAIAGIPGHHHHLEEAAAVNQPAAVTGFRGMIEIGPGKQLFGPQARVAQQVPRPAGGPVFFGLDFPDQGLQR